MFSPGSCSQDHSEFLILYLVCSRPRAQPHSNYKATTRKVLVSSALSLSWLAVVVFDVNRLHGAAVSSTVLVCVQCPVVSPLSGHNIVISEHSLETTEHLQPGRETKNIHNFYMRPDRTRQGRQSEGWDKESCGTVWRYKTQYRRKDNWIYSLDFPRGARHYMERIAGIFCIRRKWVSIYYFVKYKFGIQ